MKTNLKRVSGNWDEGYALDKHLIRSTFVGHNEYGYPQFDNERTEIGEAVYRLKYKSDFSQAPLLAAEINSNILPIVDPVHFIISAPATNNRDRQPVPEVASELSKITGIPYFPDFIAKADQDAPVASLKNLRSKEEKIVALQGRFVKRYNLSGSGTYNAIIVDDLYDSGATMEAVCGLVRRDEKVGKVYVAALTWK